MKRILLLLAFILALLQTNFAQDLSKDLVIIDPSYPNFEVLKTQYQGKPNVVVLQVSQIMAPVQIAQALNGKQVVDLHVFVAGKPGTMGFGNIAFNLDVVSNYANVLSTWKSHVSGKVVVHNQDVFLSDAGIALKAKIEQLTGLSFIMQ